MSNLGLLKAIRWRLPSPDLHATSHCHPLRLITKRQSNLSLPSASSIIQDLMRISFRGLPRSFVLHKPGTSSSFTPIPQQTTSQNGFCNHCQGHWRRKRLSYIKFMASQRCMYTQPPKVRIIKYMLDCLCLNHRADHARRILGMVSVACCVLVLPCKGLSESRHLDY